MNNYWNKKRLKTWCYRFIMDNKRFPSLNDLTLLSSQNNSPDPVIVKSVYDSIENMISCCGPHEQSKKSYALGEIKKGIDKFFSIHEHYPSAMEFDHCEYLPSARTVQRSWGGLTSLRKLFNYDVVNFSMGDSRSKTASRIFNRSILEEDEIESTLVEKFGEMFVHNQKRIYGVNVDFYVYTPTIRFGVDVFNYVDKHSMIGCILHKQKVYKNFSNKIVFLPFRKDVKQNEIDIIIANKKIPMPIQQLVMSYTSFINWINSLDRYNVSENL